MKRILTLLLAAATLFAVASTAIAGEETSVFIADECAPAIFEGGDIIVDDLYSAAEVLSFFKNAAALSATKADGTPLELADDAICGSKIVCGGESRTVVVRGDVTADGKVNSRDVVEAMRAAVSESAPVASDVNADGVLNATDVIALMRKLVGYAVFFGEASSLAKSGDRDVDVYFDSLMHRVSGRDTTVYNSASGVFHMAKSETEDARLCIVSAKQIAEVTVDVGALRNAAGDSLDVTVLDEYCWGHSVYTDILSGKVFASPIEGGPFAEALPKLLAPIDLQTDMSRGVVIQVMTGPSTASGWYKAPVALKTSDGAVVKEAMLRFYVWNFTLDEKPAMESAFGFNFDGAFTAKAKEDAKKTGEDYIKLVNDHDYRAQYYQSTIDDYLKVFLDSRISPYHLPYSITDSRADEIMSNPRITSFCVDGGGNYHNALKEAIAKGEWITSDSALLADYRKLATNPDWLHKAYIYYVDEPSPYNVYLAREVREHMDALFDSTDDLKGVEWHQVVPMGGNDVFVDEFGIKTDENDYVYRYVDIMIPQTYAFSIYYSNAERKEAMKQGIELFPPGAMINRWIGAETWKLYPMQWQQRYDKYADEQGLRRWWYICCSPELPYPNFFTYYQGAPQRVVLWQQYMFHVEGLLYWATQDQWDKTNLKIFPTNGDGVLLYWGELWGQSGPVVSIRWEYIRDGIEDFQYFSQLERTGVSRDEIVSKYINRATTDILKFSQDPYLYESTRVEIGFALEHASVAD